jgi:hypothetical protein
MIYLASPYSSPDPKVREWRYQQACRATAKLLQQGLVVISPIVHSHPLVAHGLPTTWAFWSRIDGEYLAHCKVLAVLTLPGWQESVGVQAEIRRALELGLPVMFIEPSEIAALDSDPAKLADLLRGEVLPS